MQSDWQTFLAGTINETGDIDPTATALCALSQFGVLRVSGEEAQAFLQNLLSNDIRQVSATQAQFSSFNSAKGRMLATFLIWRDGDDYLLQLPKILAETLRKKLSMYVLRARVKITDDTNNLISIGLFGNNAQMLLPDGTGELVQMGVAQATGLSIIRLGEQRFMLNATPEQAQALWQTLASGARPVDGAYWDWLNVRAGIPVILPRTQEQFVPQMANLDLIGAINFKKGCYPGQEIVARMHYLGKLKRRMYLAHIESESAPQAGDEIYSADIPEPGQDQAPPCGMIANAAPAPGGGYDVLVVMQIASHDTQTVHLAQGGTLQFEALPYPLP